MEDNNPFDISLDQLKKLKPNKYTLYFIIILIIAFITFRVTYTVDQKEKAVITRFGHYLKTETPGLHIRVPIIDKVYKVSTEVNHSLAFGYRTNTPGVQTTFSKQDYSSESKMLTGDLNIIFLPFVIQYRIYDPFKWLFGIDNEVIQTVYGFIDNREKTIRDVCISIINKYVGDTTAEYVQEKGKELIAERAKVDINKMLSKLNLGVKILNINLSEVIYPDDVQKAIEDVNAAEQDRDRLINEGQEAYDKVIPMIIGQAEQIVQGAEGQVAKFNALYKEYKKSPAIFKQRFYYETLETIFKDKDRVEIIDRNLKNFLPIKQFSKGGNQ